MRLTLSLVRPSETNEIPSAHAIRMIANEFNIVFPADARIWIEEYEPGRSSVNIVVMVDT
jgi:hypothetical protein